jgi:signal transduction histidine kinase
LILHLRSTLGSIRNFTELSRGKFRDKEFGESFYRFITKDIENADLLLNGLLNYIKTSTPIRKTNTVHTLIEQILMKYRDQLEEKRIKTFKKFEKNLPETIIPDEQLKYILNSVLQYAVVSTPPNCNIEFLTKFFILQRGGGGVQSFFEEYGGYIEILVVFANDRKPVGRSGTALEGIPSPQKDEALDLILRLVKEMVLRNRGMMKFETDEKKAKTIISLGFPVERREVIFYEPISINPPTNPPFGSIPNVPFL